jgi:hypothetical protein
MRRACCPLGSLCAGSAGAAAAAARRGALSSRLNGPCTRRWHADADPAKRPAHAALFEPLFEELYRRAVESDGGALRCASGWSGSRRCASPERCASTVAIARPRRALGIGRRTLYTKMERLGIGPT